MVVSRRRNDPSCQGQATAKTQRVQTRQSDWLDGTTLRNADLPLEEASANWEQT
jgi:hypothetical protein